jgi:hypothetical protein
MGSLKSRIDPWTTHAKRISRAVSIEGYVKKKIECYQINLTMEHLTLRSKLVRGQLVVAER